VTEDCPYCRGSGRVPIGDEFFATYIALSTAGEIHAAELAKRMSVPCSGEAMCNRLRGLEKKGLATSRVSGRRRLYTAVNVFKQSRKRPER
jgi:sugar-specific transcriptional regulator TrmB